MRRSKSRRRRSSHARLDEYAEVEDAALPVEYGARADHVMPSHDVRRRVSWATFHQMNRPTSVVWRHTTGKLLPIPYCSVLQPFSLLMLVWTELVTRSESARTPPRRVQIAAEAMSVGVVSRRGPETAAKLLDEVRRAGVADRAGHVHHAEPAL